MRLRDQFANDPGFTHCNRGKNIVPRTVSGQVFDDLSSAATKIGCPADNLQFVDNRLRHRVRAAFDEKTDYSEVLLLGGPDAGP